MASKLFLIQAASLTLAGVSSIVRSGVENGLLGRQLVQFAEIHLPQDLEPEQVQAYQLSQGQLHPFKMHASMMPVSLIRQLFRIEVDLIPDPTKQNPLPCVCIAHHRSS